MINKHFFKTVIIFTLMVALGIFTLFYFKGQFKDEDTQISTEDQEYLNAENEENLTE